jgi:DNA repair protein RadD
MDHVGNVGQMIGGEFVPNHGLPTDEREWTLDGEMCSKRAKKEKTGPSVCMCENCYGVFLSALRVCPYCGTERVVRARQLEQQAGELVQLSGELIRKQKAEARMEVGRAKTLAELEAIAAARGYKKGWARIMYDARKDKQQNQNSGQ